MVDPGAMLTVKDAAAYLSVHRNVVYGWLREGHLPAVRLGGNGTYRIAVSDLQRALEAWRTGANGSENSDSGRE